MRGKKKTIEQHKLDGTLRNYHKDKQISTSGATIIQIEILNQYERIKKSLNKLEPESEAYGKLIKVLLSIEKQLRDITLLENNEKAETDIISKLINDKNNEK